MKKTIFLLVSALALLSTPFGSALENKSAYGATSDNIYYIDVEVSDGDSLSTIAQRYNSGSLNPSQYVRLIKKFNRMRTDYLIPGTNIIVPVLGSR